jgi:hypothetical protein
MGDEVANENIAAFVIDHIDKDADLLSGWYPYNKIRLSIAENDQNPEQLDLVTYNNQTYGYVIGEVNMSKSKHFDYVVIDENYISRPVQRGLTDWTYFEPFEQHESEIVNNRDLNRVYSSESYAIYKDSTLG